MSQRVLRAAGLLTFALALPLGGCDEKIMLGIDETPPSASISGPADGADVSGVAFRVQVDATDAGSGIDRVEFRVNGVLTSTVTGPGPHETSVVTLAEAADAEVIVAVTAVDRSGNSAVTSATYTVRARTIERLTDSPNDDMNPAWSPDGTRIAFQAKRNGDQFDLWVMNADGTGQTELTANVNEDRNPSWSPDGDWIAFDTDRAGTFDIWRLPLATGEPGAEAVTFGNRDDVEPVWMPGGVDLYFASDRGDNAPFNIWRVPNFGDDSDAVQVTAFDTPDRAPALSADGGYLAFSSSLNSGSLPRIYTMRVGQIDVSPLTGTTGVTESDPVWIPGANAVLYSRDEGLDGNLWFRYVGAETAPMQATFGSGAVGDGGGAWSPDGSRLAFHSDRDGNLEIYVME